MGTGSSRTSPRSLCGMVRIIAPMKKGLLLDLKGLRKPLRSVVATHYSVQSPSVSLRGLTCPPKGTPAACPDGATPSQCPFGRDRTQYPSLPPTNPLAPNAKRSPAFSNLLLTRPRPLCYTNLCDFGPCHIIPCFALQLIFHRNDNRRTLWAGKRHRPR